jgi:DNA repair photolyase
MRTSGSQLDFFGAPQPGAPAIKPDGSVPGATVIYAPTGPALEYAALATNPYRGCGHSCTYCSVPVTTHQDRAEFDAGAVLRTDYLPKLRKDAALYRRAGVIEQILLAFITDPYHPEEHKTGTTRTFLEVLREHDQSFSILSKGGTRALRDLDLFRSDRDCYGVTLTGIDDRLSKKWERNAPLPGDRIAALRAFHDAGIFTWVSIEPVVSVEASLQAIAATHEFVDLYKVGRMNYLNLPIDWREFTLRALDLLSKYGSRFYIKKDLQQFLPPDYANPLRVPQHHGASGD